MNIVVEGAEPRFAEFRFKEFVNWRMEHGQQWAVVGPNGAGKSLFTDLLQGKVALRKGYVKFFDEDGVEQFGAIRSLTFRDIHTLADCNVPILKKSDGSIRNWSCFEKARLSGPRINVLNVLV